MELFSISIKMRETCKQPLAHASLIGNIVRHCEKHNSHPVKVIEDKLEHVKEENLWIRSVKVAMEKGQIKNVHSWLMKNMR